MLSQLRINEPKYQSDCAVQVPQVDNRWQRNMQDDMKEAIDLVFKMKAGLDKLHPECLAIVERMISLPGRGF